MKPEQERLTTVLKDTISLLCKNSLSFEKQVVVQGIIAITVDKEDVVVIQVNDSVGQPNYDPCVACGHAKERPPDEEPAEPPSRKRARSPSGAPDTPSKTPRSDRSSVHSYQDDSLSQIPPDDSDPAADDSNTTVRIKKEEIASDDEDLILIDSEFKSEQSGYDDTGGYNMPYSSTSTDSPYITGIIDNSQISGITAADTSQSEAAWSHGAMGHDTSASQVGGQSSMYLNPLTQRNYSNAFQPMAGYSEDGDRRYRCSWAGCTKRFREKHHLKNHLLIHLGALPYPCDFCAKKFRRRDSLKLHMRHIHKLDLPPTAGYSVIPAVSRLSTEPPVSGYDAQSTETASGNDAPLAECSSEARDIPVASYSGDPPCERYISESGPAGDPPVISRSTASDCEPPVTSYNAENSQSE